MTPRLCSYIVKRDSGFAPNPYWGFCTLAACTPNHMGVKLCRGDWIAGFLSERSRSSRQRSHRLLYAMEISAVMHMNDYFHDARFQRKKPRLSGNGKKCCGDNIYRQNTSGEWVQSKNMSHGLSCLAQDTKHPYVFIGREFWYFGRKRIHLPKKFKPLVKNGRGIKMNRDATLVDEFCTWIKKRKSGIHAMSNDASINCNQSNRSCS